MSKETGGAAFPSPGVLMDDGRGGEYQQGAYEGMTLRDYFAAAALTGMLSDPNFDETPEETARLCMRVADAFVAERAK